MSRHGSPVVLRDLYVLAPRRRRRRQRLELVAVYGVLFAVGAWLGWAAGGRLW
jgi:hypothetical protein